MTWKHVITTGALVGGLNLAPAMTPSFSAAQAQTPMDQVPTPMDQERALGSEVRSSIDKKSSTANHVDVEVDANGAARLTGFVESDSEKQAVIEAAKNTPGVTSVTEDLRVVPITTP